MFRIVLRSEFNLLCRAHASRISPIVQSAQVFANAKRFQSAKDGGSQRWHSFYRRGGEARKQPQPLRKGRLGGDASDVTVIFAGYRKDLVKLYNINEGLERRIHMEIHLDDYKPHELMRIFMDKAENHAGYKFIYNTNRESFQASLQERFNTTVMQNTIPRYNAGLVDHLMNSAATAIATRAAEDKNVDRKLLIEQDVEQAFKQLEERLDQRRKWLELL